MAFVHVQAIVGVEGVLFKRVTWLIYCCWKIICVVQGKGLLKWIIDMVHEFSFMRKSDIIERFCFKMYRLYVVKILSTLPVPVYSSSTLFFLGLKRTLIWGKYFIALFSYEYRVYNLEPKKEEKKLVFTHLRQQIPLRKCTAPTTYTVGRIIE